MDAATAVILTVVIVTGGDKPNIKHDEPMPDKQTCMAEAEKLLNHEFPEFMDAKGVFVGCRAPAVKNTPS
jgi:hypothetical protein